MSERNLLITILDTNPIWWSAFSSGLIPNSNRSFDLNGCLSAVVGFLNAYKTMNQLNAVALIAAHNKKAEYLYPNRQRVLEKFSSPWDKYEQIEDMDEHIKANLQTISNQQLRDLSDETNNKDNISNDSMITSAIGLALCYVNRMQRKYAFGDTINYRILVIKGSEDSSNQYMSFMNMVFSAEKFNVLIDACSLCHDSALMQQASNLTGGFYFKVPQCSGLLSYLLWLFLPERATRQMLVYPPKVQVDFRAACFCHRKLIDTGYVCSVCLSVFCSFTPICSTCNCNFQFDVNMLKKASLIKQVHGVGSKLGSSSSSAQASHLSTSAMAATGTPLGSYSGTSSGISGDTNAQRLASKFQDTSLSSPLNNMLLMSDNSNDKPPSVGAPASSHRITSSSSSARLIAGEATSTTMPAPFEDSLDMIE